MKRCLIVFSLILSLMVCFVGSGLTDGVEYESDYETGIKMASNDLTNVKQLQTAVDLLQQLGSYKLSKSYVQYFQSIVDLLQKAPDFSRIRMRLELCGQAASFAADLESRGLPSCELLITYVDTRILESNANYKKAKEAYAGMAVLDSAERAWNLGLLLSIKKGDVVTFGHYEQDGYQNNGKEPIEWIVLSVDYKGHAVLISKYIIDAHEFSSATTTCDWGNSSIRTWLNSNFANSAFNKTEQTMVLLTTSIDYKKNNSKTGTTTDQIYLMSVDETYAYLGETNNDKMCRMTNYAMKKYNSFRYINGTAYGEWWLRSYWKGDDGMVWVNYILPDGGGMGVSPNIQLGIRPMCQVDLYQLMLLSEE